MEQTIKDYTDLINQYTKEETNLTQEQIDSLYPRIKEIINQSKIYNAEIDKIRNIIEE